MQCNSKARVKDSLILGTKESLEQRYKLSQPSRSTGMLGDSRVQMYLHDNKMSNIQTSSVTSGVRHTESAFISQCALLSHCPDSTIATVLGQRPGFKLSIHSSHDARAGRGKKRAVRPRAQQPHLSREHPLLTRRKHSWLTMHKGIRMETREQEEVLLDTYLAEGLHFS